MELDLKQTLTSGQCFRASEQNGVWTVFATSKQNLHVLTVTQNDLSPILNDEFWFNYFDMGFSYSKLKQQFSSYDETLKKACAYAPGIRILNQDPWEALCSFVVSQNNNIKRISTIIKKMCSAFGVSNAFPSAKVLSEASVEQLNQCGLGFRSQYIKNTAQAVLDGTIDFEKLKNKPIDECRKNLMLIKGIGPKVADCALLFGLHRLDCFPMDVWMKKVMNKYYPNKDSSYFGQYAGIAQQYLFHWARTSGDLL